MKAWVLRHRRRDNDSRDNWSKKWVNQRVRG